MKQYIEAEQEIWGEIERVLDDQILEISSIHRGWKNEKWFLHTNKEKRLFVKSYDLTRMTPSKLERARRGLHAQQMLNHAGIPCPEVYMHQNELIWSAGLFQFVVMEQSKGKSIKSGGCSIAQMESWGEYTAKMHQVFSQFPRRGAEAQVDTIQGIEDYLKKVRDSLNGNQGKGQRSSHTFGDGLQQMEEIIAKCKKREWETPLLIPSWVHGIS